MQNNQTAPVVRTASFANTELTIIDHNGDSWLTGEQIGIALQMANPAKAINTLFQRNKVEFEEGVDTSTLEMRVESGVQRTVRVFSPTGCNLLGFFSKAKKGREFRSWAKRELAKPSTLQTEVLPQREQELLKELRPELGKIAHYHSLGLNLSEIGRLMKMNPGSIVHALDRLTRLRLLPQSGSMLKSA